jgi:hypothetical protein
MSYLYQILLSGPPAEIRIDSGNVADYALQQPVKLPCTINPLRVEWHHLRVQTASFSMRYQILSRLYDRKTIQMSCPINIPL